MEPYVAFFDDSGQADPERDTYYNLGMAVAPFTELKDISNQWWMMIKKTLDLPNAPTQLGVEAKWTELREYARRVQSGKCTKEDKRFRGFVEAGVTAEAAFTLVDRCVDFIANCDALTLIGVSVNKPANWSQFQSWDYDEYIFLTECKGTPKQIAPVRAGLRRNVRNKAFEWGVLQRLQYFLEDKGNSPCILIGDEGDAQQEWYSAHSRVHNGNGRYTTSSNVIGNVVFGSSIHNPGLQISDWVALAIRQWAEGRPDLLARVLHRFRGYPDNVQGRGITMLPQPKDFPNLPPGKPNAANK